MYAHGLMPQVRGSLGHLVGRSYVPSNITTASVLLWSVLECNIREGVPASQACQGPFVLHHKQSQWIEHVHIPGSAALIIPCLLL